MSSTIRIADKDKLTIISNLSTMMHAGIPLVEAVDAIRTESRGGSKRFLNLASQCLNEGRPLSDAFAMAPEAFDAVTVNLVRAAEQSGGLDSCLADLAISIKHQVAFKNQLRSSLLYPAFIMAVFCCVLVVILTFVVPRLGKVYSTLRIPTPWTTKVLIKMSAFLLHYYVFVAIVAVAAVIGLILFFKYRGRQAANILMKLPMVHQLGIKIDLARFTHTLSELLKASITIVEALDIAKDVVVNQKVTDMVMETRDKMATGEPLADCLRRHPDIVPAMMTQLIDAAEKSGSLDAVMHELSAHYEIEVRRALKSFAVLLEPIALVVIGIIVGGMMYSVMSPMYRMMNQLQTVQQQRQD